MDIRIVDGRLTKDAEVKINKTTGTKFLSFTLANNGFAKGAQVTTFFNVVSYNEFDIERQANFTKGTLVVVSGRPNESMTIKENKTYLNRNIMAHSIEKGTPSFKENNSQSATYHDVAPVSATCEVPQIPQVSAPSVSIVEVPKNNVIDEVAIKQPIYQVNINTDDDLPF